MSRPTETPPGRAPDVDGGPPRRPARRLTLLLHVQDHHRHVSLMVELLGRARRQRLAGATVFEGHQGFGATGTVRRTHLLRDDAPLAIVVVDDPARIDRFVESIADLLGDVLAVVEEVTVVEV